MAKWDLVSLLAKRDHYEGLIASIRLLAGHHVLSIGLPASFCGWHSLFLARLPAHPLFLQLAQRVYAQHLQTY